MKQVLWTKKVLESFIEKAMLTEDEAYIMRSRCQGVTVVEQAHKLHKSEATVHRMISSLKKKYDVVQAEYPEEFPPRKYSAQEEYMDTH